MNPDATTGPKQQTRAAAEPAAVQGASPDGKITVTKTANPTTLPLGGGSVTYTYTVKNNSTFAWSDPADTETLRHSMVLSTLDDDKCWPLQPKPNTDLVTNYGRSYILPGQTAEWTCTTNLTKTTTNKVTADFYEYFNSANHAVATATATVTINSVPGAVSCDTLWYSSDNNGNTSGRINTVTTDGTVGTNPHPIPGTSTGGVLGSAAVAVDPQHPNLIYYVPRNYNNGAYGALRVYDSTATGSGQDEAAPNNGNTPMVVRLGFDNNGTLWTLTGNGRLWSWTASGGWKDRGAVTLPSSYSWNELGSGDLAFDGLGNMWFIGSTQSGATLFTIDPRELAGTDGATAKRVGTMGPHWFHGLAFDDAGNLYATGDEGGRTYLYNVDKKIGLSTKIKEIGTDIADLASCALPTPELRVTKTGVLKDGVITYTITVQNTGNLEAVDVKFFDAVPDHSTYVRNSTRMNGSATGVGDVGGQPYFATNRPEGRLIKSAEATHLGTVAAGDTATITFQVRASTSATDVCNQGTVDFSGSTAALKTDDPSQAGYQDPTCVNPVTAVVGIDKKADKHIVTPGAEGQKVVYTYDVTTHQNLWHGYPEPAQQETGKPVGADTLTNIVVADDKCSPLTYASGDTNSDGKLQPGETWHYTCTSTNVSLTDETSNTATVTAVGAISQKLVHDSDIWKVRPLTFKTEKLAYNGQAGGIDQWAPTGAKVTLNPDGTGTARYRVTVTNTGKVAGKHPAITDTLTVPAGFTITGATLNDTELTLSGNQFTIPAGTTDLTPGATSTYVIVVSLRANLTQVDAATVGTCNTEGTGDPTKGIFNQVAMAHDGDGADNNDACVPVEIPKQSITLIKKGMYCSPEQTECTLSGAQFSLYGTDPSAGGAEAIQSGTSQADGTINFTDLLVGKDYWLMETKAAPGFQLLANPIKFQVTGTGIALPEGNTEGAVVEIDQFTITVKDTKTGELPKSGRQGPYGFAGFGLLLIAAAAIYYKKTS